jgi:hypothetical protein
MRIVGLLFASVFFACNVAGDPAEGPDAGDASSADVRLAAPCAVAPTDSFAGRAARSNDSGYPDSISANVTWMRVASNGCVDSYAPSGTVTYGYAIPGALCTQSISPATHVITRTDGSLTVDRSTNPPTITAHGTTTWPVTWTCVENDGTTNTQSFDGGGTWVDATALGGRVTQTDNARCGAPNGVAPCTYAWRFAP